MIVKIIIALFVYDVVKFIISVVATVILKKKKPETVRKSWDERIAEMQANRSKIVK